MPGRPRTFWIPLVAAVERGADPTLVAQQHEVKRSTLLWWRTVFRREQREKTPALLPVVVRDEAPAKADLPGEIEVLAGGGAVLRVPVGSDVGYVASLVRALGARC